MSRRVLVGLLLLLILPLAAAPCTLPRTALAAESASADEDPDALNQLVAASRYDEAIVLGWQLVEDAREEFGADSREEALILDGLLEALYRSGHAMEEETLELSDRALKLTELHFGAESAELAGTLLQAGNLRIYRGENEAARACYEAALKILEDSGDRTNPRYGLALNNLGVTWKRSGDYAKALEIYQRALEVQEEVRGPEHFEVASSLNNIANVLVQMGDYAGAIACHRRALRIREAHYGSDGEWVAESLNNLATVLGYAGEYDEALAVQERAVEVLASALGQEHERYWSARFNLAVLYNDMGDFGTALPIYVEVLEDEERRFGKDHAILIETLDAQAGCRTALGEYATAESLFRRSLAISEAEYGVGNPWTVYTLQGLGECLAHEGRLDEASQFLFQALEVQEDAVEPDSPQLCEFLHSLARLQLMRGEVMEARRLAERSVSILEASFTTDHPLLAQALFLSAELEYAIGDEQAAMALALRAEAVSRRHLRDTMAVLSEHLALDYGRSRVTGLDLAITMLFDGESGARVAAVWDQVIRSRALVLDEMAARGRILVDEDDPEYAALLIRLQDARSRLAHLSLRGPGWEELSAYRLMLDQAAEEKDAAERALALAHREFRDEAQLRSVGLEEVASTLEPGDQLLAFVRSGRVEPRGVETAEQRDDDEDADFYAAFILDSADSEPRFVHLGSSEELDAAVEEWREQAAYGTQVSQPGLTTRGFIKRERDPEAQQQDYEEVARELRRRVWDPVVAGEQLPSRLRLVGDGSLHLVNFYALVEDDGSYLLESGPLIQLLPTERSLCVRTDGEPELRRLLVVGDPNSDSGDPRRADTRSSGGELDCPSLEDLDFGPLVGAREEAQEIFDLWTASYDAPRSAKMLIGPEATESAIKREAAEYGVLHFATHGFLLSTHCSGTHGFAGAWENPLLRSGLAFAGANQRGERTDGEEDGLLTAEEVAGLDLSRVEWAVLSACDTGLGGIEDQGEGVFGLSRSFQVAGVRTVVMSLWAVDDVSTRRWMRDLYESRFAKGMGAIEAVRSASLESLRRLRESDEGDHPYYWAGFVALGNGQ